MEVRFANDFSDSSLRDSWNGILTQTNYANVQLTYEWLYSWWEIYGRGEKLSLLTVTDQGRTLGVAPLTVTKVIGKSGFVLNKLTFVGHGLTDYHDLLIADERREEVLRALIEFILNGRENWDAIHLRNIRGDSPNLPILREAFCDASLTCVDRSNIKCSYIPMDCGWTDYYGALSKNMKSDIRRRSNCLARTGKAEFVRLHEVDDVDNVMRTIKSIHVKCRQSKGETSWYTDERRYRFVSMILKRFSYRKWLDLVFLKLDGRIIAYYLGFLYDNVVYFWNTGFDPEFSQVSPGKLLLHYWIEDSFAEGCREFDFMVGEESYKSKWTSPVRQNYELFMFKNTVRSNLLKCYYTYKPMLRKNSYLRKIGHGMISMMKD